MNSTKSPYFYLSKYRSALMGVAILWVVFFHSSVPCDFFSINFLNHIIVFIKYIGYGGVDIFLFVSGMGIYNSLEENNISAYIKNRVKRIVPVWWIYLILRIVLGLLIFQGHLTKLQILGFATFTGYWCNMSNQGNWYVYAIVLFYLLSPVMHSLIKSRGSRIALIIASLLVSFSFIGTSKFVVFSRLPVYIIGMYVSSALKETRIKKRDWIICFMLLVAGIATLFIFWKHFNEYLLAYGMSWYPFIVIAPTMSLLLAKGFDILYKYFKWLVSLLSVLGKASLEILLVSEYIFWDIGKLNITIISDRITATGEIVVSVVLGCLFYFGVEFCKSKYDHLKKTNCE